ncbi:uncharacterized protein LOC125770765 isoform X2 [Anopheles funestus]|uniref:uncharacterized protein LOC125770765 isoform X2 n=1 Tax=Anopheles funestus TaxID=62324 RepID=UPI0020C618E1|nr:uncharacterized protein LOC125770765 isoform X2 [Anopheles funestus]
MSDDDAPRTTVSPPLNCAKIEAASSPVEFQELEHPFVKGENVSDGVKVKPETESPESNDTCVVQLRSNDHEASKVKQRKCVQFTTTTTIPPGTADDTLRKFIEGEEILDKKNPFKIDEQQYDAEQYADRRMLHNATVRDKCFPDDGATFLTESPDGGGNDADDSDTDLDDNVFITKEEILRQSKYVKTYIKNPDKQLNYDKSVIQQMDALKAKGLAVRDVVVVESAPMPAVVRPPIPAPRAIHRQSDRNNNNRRQSFLPQMSRGGMRKPIPRARRDYAEVKVRTGSAEAEESLYDSNEVVQNALKFDSRFRKVEFGSQDDIDTIAERTEDGTDQPAVSVCTVQHETRPAVREKEPNASPSKDRSDGRKTTFAEDVKKSFSNTVKSADFRKYLQSKGLSLVPAKPKPIEPSQPGRRPHETDSPNKAHRLSTISVSSTPAPGRHTPVKPSMLTRFFQNSLFAPKTPNDPAYSSVFARSSTPVLFSTQPRQTRPQPPARIGSFNSSLSKRSAATVDVKPKDNFRQLVEGRGDTMNAPVSRRPASVNDFERPKLRSQLANRSASLVDSLKRPVKNAGVQVNLATDASNKGQIVRNSQLAEMQQRFIASQPNGGAGAGGLPLKDPVVGQKYQHHPVTYHSLRQRPDARFYGGSMHTVAPLYSEPLRDAQMRVPDETDSGFRSTLDNGYHIYEQTPDNLRRSEMLYGKIGYLSNTQLNRWQPQDRRSYSSMQEGVTGMNGGTYGRLRPLYVSSPMSTQSTPVRRASDVMDREQILHRIYDFCRRSIRNSSKTSVHSNQTEPTYQSNNVYGSKIVPSGSFPVERQRVQRVQSLNTPRPIATNHGALNYTRAVAVPVPMNSFNQANLTTASQNQHERNIENIYAFVNKKMVQMNVGGAVDHRNNIRSVQTSAPSTLRRVTFSSKGTGHDGLTDGLEEADYVNIRGAPDGIQYRTTQC